MTAGLFAARGKIKTLLLEKGAAGGQVLNTDWIDNYPGFPDGIAGFELAEKIEAQAKRFDLETRYGEVECMNLLGPVKKIALENGDLITADTVIIATGSKPNHLNVPGEMELVGKGVSYCATCDGPFFRDQEIAVVGGGSTAVQEAVHLTKFASKVTLVHRRGSLRATKILQDQAFNNDKIEFIWDTVVTSINGKDLVRSVSLLHKNGQESSLDVEGLFVLVGIKPNNEMLPEGQLTLENGFIPTDNQMRTNIPGVFAAGDICSKPFRQIVNATGEAAVAALSAEHYLMNELHTQK